MEQAERTTEEILQAAVETATGMTIAHIRSTPIDDLRREIEKKFGGPMKFVSEFPFIGRGNVLRDRLVARAQVEADLDEALRR